MPADVYKIEGVVQGVGFRPFIFRKCAELGIKGFVMNTGDGVELAIDKKELLKEILSDIPQNASIEKITHVRREEKNYDEFRIEQSTKNSSDISIMPDVATCYKCTQELYDSKNRRNNYFFITCTDCGPRFSIVKKLPYDRQNTTMNGFEMCPECRKEFSEPASRRFHAQTIACKKCGPALLYKKGAQNTTLDEVVNDLLSGKIISVKGIGGFHLACIAKSGPVNKLRKITGRPKKPFAIMVKDIRAAERLCEIDENEKRLLESPSRPIVTLKKKDRNSFSEISELDTLGIMLPYTPLHHMIFREINSPLVMTSSNYPGEPLTTTDKEQFVKNILTYNREISNRVDDSVIKVIGNKTLFLRRSRGYVPLPVKLKTNLGKTSLALGAEQNNTFSILKGDKVFISQHMGDTSNHKSFTAMKHHVKKWMNLLSVKPDKIVCDLHPDFNTTQFARELSEKLNIPIRQVQHHEAHANSVMMEHGLDEAFSVVFDGTGYGRDNKIWGGEFFVSRDGRQKRIASLEEHIMPGGEAAIKKPWRMLAGILSSFLGEDELKKEMKQFISGNNFSVFNLQIRKRFNSPLTTSCGRVLDAAAAFLGLCDEMYYDGRPAMLLESAAYGEPYEIEPVIERGERIILKTAPLFEFLIENRDRDKRRLAMTVHNYIAEGIIKIAQMQSGELPKTFSGGVAYNRHITSALLKDGFLINEKVPAGDGGVSFGQVHF